MASACDPESYRLASAGCEGKSGQGEAGGAEGGTEGGGAEDYDGHIDDYYSLYRHDNCPADLHYLSYPCIRPPGPPRVVPSPSSSPLRGGPHDAAAAAAAAAATSTATSTASGGGPGGAEEASRYAHYADFYRVVLDESLGAVEGAYERVTNPSGVDGGSRRGAVLAVGSGLGGVGLVMDQWEPFRDVSRIVCADLVKWHTEAAQMRVGPKVSPRVSFDVADVTNMRGSSSGSSGSSSSSGSSESSGSSGSGGGAIPNGDTAPYTASYADGTFSFVCDEVALSHLRGEYRHLLAPAAREMKRVVREDGIVVLSG